jgi:hypothetical protein
VPLGGCNICVEQQELNRGSAARGFAAGRAGKRRGVAGIDEIDASGVEVDVAIEDDVNGRAAREFQFGAAREQHGCEADGRAGAGADARALGALRGEPSDACPNSGRFQNGSDVIALVRIAVNFSFFVGRFVAARPGIGGDGVKIHRVAVWKNHGIQAQADFARAFYFAGALGFLDLALHVGSGGNENSVVDHDWEEGFEVDRVTRLGISRGHGVVQDQR